MAYYPANPVDAAIRTYKDVEGIFRGKREEARREEDRQRRIAQEDEQNRRSAISFEQSQKAYADTEKLRLINHFQAMLSSVRGIRDPEQRQRAFQALIGQMPPELRKQAVGLVNQIPMADLQQAKQLADAGSANFHEVMMGQSSDPQTAITAVNAFSDSILNQGGSQEGTVPINKSISSASFAPNGMLIANLKNRVLDENTGETKDYEAVYTQNRSADPSDFVKQFDPADIAESLEQMSMMSDFLIAMKAQYGDPSAAAELQRKADESDLDEAMDKVDQAMIKSFKAGAGYRQNFAAMVEAGKKAVGTKRVPMSVIRETASRHIQLAAMDEKESLLRAKVANSGSGGGSGSTGPAVDEEPRLKLKDRIAHVHSLHSKYVKAMEGQGEFGVLDEDTKRAVVKETKGALDAALLGMRRDGYLQEYHDWARATGYKPPAADPEALEELYANYDNKDFKRMFAITYGYLPAKPSPKPKASAAKNSGADSQPAIKTKEKPKRDFSADRKARLEEFENAWPRAGIID